MMTCLNQINERLFSKRLFYALFLAVSLLAVNATVKTVKAEQLKVEIVKVKSAKGEYYFNTEIAKTDREREKGLMYRQSLARDAAMLFLWDTDRPIQMWMKNTNIPLDMVFIRSDGKIANIAHKTIPHSRRLLSSKGQVRAVLELSAGTAEKIGLAEGNRVFHRVFK